jgi:hypothetical protein
MINGVIANLVLLVVSLKYPTMSFIVDTFQLESSLWVKLQGNPRTPMDIHSAIQQQPVG